MTTEQQFPPSINAGRLTERTSAKGNTYLTGFFGGFKIVALKTDQKDDRGNPIWNLRFAENPPRERPADTAPAETKQREPRKVDDKRDWQKPTERASSTRAPEFDEIPF